MTHLSRDNVDGRAEQLDTIAAVLPMERRDELAELLTNQDVETLRHLVNQGMGENTLRALTSDLAYLQGWSLAATGASLPWPAPEALLLKFVVHHLWDPEKRLSDPQHGMPNGVEDKLRIQGFLRNQWPEALPELKPLLLSYQSEVTRVGIDVLKAIAIALGQPENVFADIYEPQPSQLLKIIRYPGRDVAETDQGVGAHKGGGFVTVLLQDTAPGLRVRTEEGIWIDAPPVPGTFIINTGELLELATNGFVRADVHDVLAPPAGTERYSVAFFLGSRYDATIPVIELPEELKRAERGISVDPLNPIFWEVGQNHLKSRLRSHPDVARAHHADLLTPSQASG